MWIACVAVFVCYQDYKITKMGEGNLHPRRPPREYLSEYTSLDTGDLSMLTLLDLSAAFDTVDHQILIRRLETSYGLGGVVLSWFKSYIPRQSYSVRPLWQIDINSGYSYFRSSTGVEADSVPALHS